MEWAGLEAMVRNPGFSEDSGKRQTVTQGCPCHSGTISAHSKTRWYILKSTPPPRPHPALESVCRSFFLRALWGLEQQDGRWDWPSGSRSSWAFNSHLLSLQ